MADVVCTFGDNRNDVSPAQTGLADRWSGDVRPVNHPVHTVVGDGDHHTVLMENAAQIIWSKFSERIDDFKCVMRREGSFVCFYSGILSVMYVTDALEDLFFSFVFKFHSKIKTFQRK